MKTVLLTVVIAVVSVAFAQTDKHVTFPKIVSIERCDFHAADGKCGIAYQRANGSTFWGHTVNSRVVVDEEFDCTKWNGADAQKQSDGHWAIFAVYRSTKFKDLYASCGIFENGRLKLWDDKEAWK